jgi:hypothetical protein
MCRSIGLQRSTSRLAVATAGLLALSLFLIGMAGAGAQSFSGGYGLTGRTIHLPPLSGPIRPGIRLLSSPPEMAYGEGGERFRTVCVRTCDGYYWPISFSTSREQFLADEAQCETSCNGGAQLFYHPNPGGGMADAVDLSGRAYTQLANAFLYRKKRIEGCICRPAPWSEAERARHRQYAREAAEGAPGAADAADDAGQPSGADLEGSPASTTPRAYPRRYGLPPPYSTSHAPRFMSVAPGVVLRRDR